MYINKYYSKMNVVIHRLVSLLRWMNTRTHTHTHTHTQGLPERWNKKYKRTQKHYLKWIIFCPQVGDSVAIGELRCSLGETGEWVSEMSSTTSELKGEVGQLHSEVLEGFILAEEADAKVTKNKNPRYGINNKNNNNPRCVLTMLTLEFFLFFILKNQGVS